MIAFNTDCRFDCDALPKQWQLLFCFARKLLDYRIYNISLHFCTKNKKMKTKKEEIITALNED